MIFMPANINSIVLLLTAMYHTWICVLYRYIINTMFRLQRNLVLSFIAEGVYTCVSMPVLSHLDIYATVPLHFVLSHVQ